jgi:hypothetical protein
MLGRADARSFTRFLVSAGVSLCVLAIVGPGWILRDTGTLRVTEHELSLLTKEAHTAMIHRQRIAAALGEGALWIGLLVFLVGLVLIVIGAKRLKKQETLEDTHKQAETSLLTKQLERQSPEEIKQELEGEVARQIAKEPASSLSDFRRQASDRYKRTLVVEERTLNRLRALAEAGDFEIQEHPRFQTLGSEGPTDWRVDAVLLPPERGMPVVVEIKYLPRLELEPFADLAQVLNRAVAAFRQRFEREARGWMILVASDIQPEARDRADGLATVFGGVTVTILQEDEIDGLNVPFEFGSPSAG